MEKLLQRFLNEIIKKGAVEILTPRDVFRVGDDTQPVCAIRFRDTRAALDLMRNPEFAFGELDMTGGIELVRGALRPKILPDVGILSGGVRMRLPLRPRTGAPVATGQQQGRRADHPRRYSRSRGPAAREGQRPGGDAGGALRFAACAGPCFTAACLDPDGTP